MPELVDVGTTALDEVVVVDLVLDRVTLAVAGLEIAKVVAGTLEALMLDDTLDVTGFESGTLDATLDFTRVVDELLVAATPPAVEITMLEVVGLETAELLSTTEVARVGLGLGLDATTELLCTTCVDRTGLDEAIELETITIGLIVAE